MTWNAPFSNASYTSVCSVTSPDSSQVQVAGTVITATAPKSVTISLSNHIAIGAAAQALGANCIAISGGAGTSCSVNIPHPLGQDDLSWASNIYDSTTNTIGQKGCGLTSLTMALQYAGLQTVSQTGFPLNPGTLNFFMNEALDYSGSSVDWAPATRDASNGLLKFDTLGGYKNSKTNPVAAAQALTNALCAPQPHPVIVGVTSPSSKKFPGHFVLVTGVQTNADGSKKFTIDDPFYPAISLDDYNNIFVTRGLVRDPTSDISELDFSLGDAADLLVTDPTGAQTGLVDVSTGADLQQIQNSAHFVDAYDNDLTGQAATSAGHFVDIFQPINGSFGVTAKGLKPGIFALRIRAFSQDGSAQPGLTIAGIAGVSSTSAFQVQSSSAVGSTPIVTRVATFQSTLADISNSEQLGLIDNAGIANALTSKIQAAQSAATTGQRQTAINILGAFENQLSAQTGKHVIGVAPQVLQEDAASLISQIP